MRIVRSSPHRLSGLLGVVIVTIAAQVAEAQTTKMPSTLRYGSGYLDVPVASVLPHLAVTGTLSGFFLSLDETVQTDASGRIIGFGSALSDNFWDGSVTLGLFDRVEVGTSLQSFNDSDKGGSMWGAFGRIAILRPEQQGIGLAGGVRYVAAPTFDGAGIDAAPPRLGFPDERFHKDLFDGPGDGVDTEVTVYGVASAFLRGLDSDMLPEHDVTVSLGYGTGMFQDGEKVQFYRFADSEGWFVAGALHVALTETALLNIMGEYNGFDVNVGAQFDFNGIRIGGHVLGANYWKDVGIYRSLKYGVLGSVCLDLGGGESILCRPTLMDRQAADTVQLPAPPPDTVTVTREVAPPLPTGTATDLCLATGETATVYVTAQGDTLVGPNRISIRTLRPGVVFAGSYAQGRGWFENDEAVTFEERNYDKSGGEVRLECPNTMRVGEYQGVPLFAERTAERPFETLYVPVRPGIWQAYQAGLQATRGDS